VQAALERLAIEAGQIIMRIRSDGFAAQSKSDGSPVTIADRAAEEHILAGLEKLEPATPVIAEELADSRPSLHAVSKRYFLVDPLDGTKEFISGRTDFTVNIAIVQDGVPTLGVVVAPARNEMYAGAAGSACHCLLSEDGSIIQRRRIETKARSGALTAAVSASHMSPETENFLERLMVERKVSMGSSLKFCIVATGEADIYPRLGTTMQWDTAAGDAVLRNAGGCTLCLDQSVLTYCTSPDNLKNPSFVASGTDVGTLQRMLADGR
jgi:3'(2'), 5'-bisphosphate nucleotidase